MTQRQIKLVENYIRKVVRKTLEEQTLNESNTDWKSSAAIIKRLGQIDQTGKKYGYKEFSDGDGPSEKQANLNTIALSKALNELGISTDLIKKDFGGDFPVLTVSCLGNIFINYDRWGFVSEKLRLDQADFLKTIVTILKYSHTGRIS